MDGLGVGDFGGADDGRDVEVTQAGGGGADANRLIGQLDVFRLAVGLGVDNDRANSQVATGALDAQGDFAAVGNQNLLKHGHWGAGYVSVLSSRCVRASDAMSVATSI